MAGNPIGPYEIARNEIFGRYLIASEDISAGQIIFREDPIMIGPKRFSSPICLGCHRVVDGSYFCSKCGFAMCSEKCQNIPIHAINECEIFQRKGSKPKKLPNYTSPQPLYQCILPLRLLMLKYTHPDQWTKLNEMEHHTDLRKIESPDDWHMNHINIVQFLRNWCGMDDFDEETIHKVIGFIDVNCFQVKTISHVEVCGIFLNGSIPCQDCLPNTHHAFTNNCQLIFRASVPILKGDKITMSYAPLLLGTKDRRKFLRTTKYFDCVCNRCEDPTELGTFISALKCLSCTFGYLLPKDPLNKDSLWICYVESEKEDGQRNAEEKRKCENVISPEQVVAMLGEMESKIQNVTNSENCDIISLEKVLETYAGKFLHSNHSLLIPIWKELNRLYEFEPEIMVGVQERKKEVLQRLYDVTNRLQPGLTRSRGVLLHQMYTNQYKSAKSQFEAKKITKEMYEIERTNSQNGLKATEEIFELDKLIGVTKLRRFTLN